MVLSNSSLNGVKDSIRLNALSSFLYFVRTVVGAALPDTLCLQIERVLESRQNFLVANILDKQGALLAIYHWLKSHNVCVKSESTLARHEVLEWLDFDLEDEDDVSSGEVCILTLVENGVSVRWVQ